jgi:hypothetical protein
MNCLNNSGPVLLSFLTSSPFLPIPSTCSLLLEYRISKRNEDPARQDRTPFPKFYSTFDIIHSAEEDRLPDKIMMAFHPQRWTDKPIPWMKELVWQNMKNAGKYALKQLKGRDL